MEHHSSSTGVAGVIISVFMALMSLASAQQYVSIIAGMTSIVAGIFAIRYYIKKSK